MTGPNLYSVFGLAVRSQLILWDLPSTHPDVLPDVEIVFGRVEDNGSFVPGYNVREWGTILFIPDVGRYLIRDGKEIVIHRDEHAPERDVRLFLLGSALGALLHQRGLLPLHANAIEVDGRAVAFSGHSGAGKSTIAAWFHDRGHRILTDDVCVIGFGEHGEALAYPGIPRLRLWREALELTGRSADDYGRSFGDADKFDVPTTADLLRAPVPVSRIYLLRRANEGTDSPEIRRLTGVEAIDALVANTYRGGYVKMIGATGGHLQMCLKLASAVPIFEAGRLWGFDKFEEQARMLESHCKDEL